MKAAKGTKLIHTPAQIGCVFICHDSSCENSLHSTLHRGWQRNGWGPIAFRYKGSWYASGDNTIKGPFRSRKVAFEA